MQNNIFRDFDRAIALDGIFSCTEVQLLDNVFTENSIAIEFLETIKRSQSVNAEDNQFLNSDCAILISSEQELVEITGSTNNFEDNEKNICPEGFTLPEGFMQ